MREGKPLLYQVETTWTETIWEALHAFREDLIPEGDPMFDEQWSDITTAMAWIEERLGVPSDVDIERDKGGQR